MHEIVNPVLRGFNPDPSILRVGGDYYIATSTFEWFPGVRIYHSTDLVHWRPRAYALTRRSQLDLRGYLASAGVWAPNLTFIDDRFYLVYTDVRTTGTFKDTHNRLVSARDIDGEWSEPVDLNSIGFDPSLFRDDDGRTYLVGMSWDYREHRNHFAGILVQEIALPEGRLLGPPRNIFRGSERGRTEGPHLYKIGGYYYLLTAEGGTELRHAVTIARSRELLGPYELDPGNPLLSSWDDPTSPLQKAGHGDLVETPDGEWYLAHLCSRPIPARGRSTLGRETCLQKIVWSPDLWPRLEGGGHAPRLVVPAPRRAAAPTAVFPGPAAAAAAARDEFDAPSLGPDFQTLRAPADESWLSLGARPGFLRLVGRESPSSRHGQSLVARRIQSFRCSASTCVEFEPRSFKQMAGLICLYDTTNFYYLRISRDEVAGKCLGIVVADNGVYTQPLAEEASVEGWERCHLRASIDYDRLRFAYSRDGESWLPIGPELDASTLSDEYGREGRFTGAMVGLCCQDMGGSGLFADFDYFDYREE